MVELEIDGRKVEVAEGSMLMDAARKLDIVVPHFCYHPKLSIAANCRMCLVEVEKAPKPLPACATPVAQGMIVRTRSDKAVQAQKGVMEFLLINHPLDCPICDQGGECQLQDLAVGYGGGASRYQEEKRVVFHKNAGPLVAMEEMSRCIHCTRCVRFGQEVAGMMELGMAHRGEHSEITTFLEGAIESELSGNMIDLCPVGALTSKPFRYAARTWELSRRASISPHDSIGANLVMQVKGDKVLRVVPQTNEAVNECWISDRDRFSYEGLNSAERLTVPMVRDAGAWRETDWPTAIDYVVRGLQRVLDVDGGAGIGALANPNSSSEELFLLAKLVRALGSDNIDSRLRHSDLRSTSVPSLGMALADVAQLHGALIVGSFLRKDHPLLAAKLRRAAKSGASISVLHAAGDDLLMPLHANLLAAPSQWVARLAEIAAAVADARGVARPVALAAVQAGAEATRAAQGLLEGTAKAVLLGNAAAQHPQALELEQLGRWIAAQTGASFGWTVEAGNLVGAHLMRALPQRGGKNVVQMVGQGAQTPAAMLLLDVEPEYDLHDSAAALAALRQIPFVVGFSAYQGGALAEIAQVLLPVSPFSESAGSLVNCEGRLQSYQPVVSPLGMSRPAWKVLRVLADQLGLDGFGYETFEQVHADAWTGIDVTAALAAAPSAELPAQLPAAVANGFERLAEVPLYHADAVVRRAAALQRTGDGRRAAQAALAADVWQQLGMREGDRVRVAQGGATAELDARLDPKLASGVVRVAAATAPAAQLGAMFGAITVHKI